MPYCLSSPNDEEYEPLCLEDAPLQLGIVMGKVHGLVSPRLPLIRTKSLIEHAVYHKHGQKTDDVIKRAVGVLLVGRRQQEQTWSTFSRVHSVCQLFVIVTIFPDFHIALLKPPFTRGRAVRKLVPRTPTSPMTFN